MEEHKEARDIFKVNVFFLLTTIIYIGASVIFGAMEVDFFTHVAIIQFLVLLAPVLVYILIMKQSLKQSLKLNNITIGQGLLSAAIMAVSLPIAVFINTVVLFLLSFMGNLLEPQIPTPTNANSFLLSLFFIAVLPGICEELFFRGLLFGNYEKMGVKRAILYSAIIFAIFHFDIQRLAGVLFLGIVFGYLVHYTGSIYSSMIAHTVNNGLSVTLGFLFSSVNSSKLTDNAKQASDILSETHQLLIVLIFYGIIASFCTFALVKLFKKLKKISPESHQALGVEKASWKEIGIFTRVRYFIPVIIVTALALLLNILQIRQIIMGS